MEEALGWSFRGVLVRDFYGAYNHYPGLKQGCRAHLLRDIHEIKALCPMDTRLRKWAKSVRKVYSKAKVFSRPGDRQRRWAEGSWNEGCRPIAARS